jgi:hypothetical protein
MFDAISLTVNIGVIGYLIYSIFSGGLPSLGTNYIFIGYLTFTILTLPNLLSKVIFKSRLFGITSALLFIYYPVLFLLQVGVANITGLSLNEVLPFGVIFNLILWNSLFLLFIIGDNKKGNESEVTLKEVASALLPSIVFVIFVSIFIRQRDSVVALDYLQHLTVPNKIFHNGILCILPGQCSNLFLQHGYTTFYHIILGNMTTFLGIDPVRSFYVLDIIFPLVVSIPIYIIFKKVTRSTLWSQLGVLLTLLTFVMGGYDFVFFIPQTFALYLFLLTFKETKLSTLQLILISILLFSTHFIIGTIFVGYLWFRYLVIQKLKSKKDKNVFMLLIALSVMFFLVANIAGFSVEKLIQQDAVEVIGSLTNTYYPNNLFIYLQNLGAGWLLVLIAYIGTLLEKRKDERMLSLFAFIAFGIMFYFSAPTYANKFAIGLSFFAALIVIKYLWSLGFKPVLKLLLFGCLILIWGFNYYVQYNKYLSFYTQEDGAVSAIVKEDKAMIEYIENNSLQNSFIVSDPYTQIVIAALGNVDTANAQYMQLETRNNLLEYLENPSVDTYDKLLTSSGIPGGTEINILYTSRLERTIQLNDYAWLHNIYSLPINNSYAITILDEDLLEYQKRQEKKLIYISDNFILFK